VLTSEHCAILRSRLAGDKTEQRLSLRAAIILGVVEGLSNAALALRLGYARQRPANDAAGLRQRRRPLRYGTAAPGVGL
jgi:hypothetical protein